ncbi:MAG: hypothetical protein AB7E30_10740, partial [Lawsonibacter sp.]
IGEARFTPSGKAEADLLNWLNYGIPPQSLVMVNSDFRPSENYIPIRPNETYHQRGIFRALVKEKDSGVWRPIEVRITYDWRSRSSEPGNFISSVEFNNVKIDRARGVEY